MAEIYKILIIGSGPAGLAAGIYAGRAKLKPLIVEGNMPGGQLMGTTYVENWPGEKRILGPQLMLNMREHAKSTGCNFLAQEIVRVDFSRRPFTVWTQHDKELKAESVIVATGAVPKRLNVLGEDTYWGRGVSTCAVCDGALFQDKAVVIVGGGDTAMEDASFMAKFTKNITIIQNSDRLTASEPMKNRILDNPIFSVMYNSRVDEIRGDGERVQELLVSDARIGQQKTVKADVVFVAIGLHPSTKVFKGHLELDSLGYLKVTDHTKTSVEGVFAAGDVADYRYRQAITSAGSGCMAALDAEKYLEQMQKS